MKLNNKNIVVIGASGGIGETTCVELAKRGANLILLGRNAKKLGNIKNSLKNEGSEKIKIFVIDLESKEDLEKFKKQIDKIELKVDALIHCAGEFYRETVEKSDIRNLDDVFEINFRAPYLVTQILLPCLKQSKGQIIFINSTAGLKASANTSAYSASKFALKAFADSLRDEVNEYGVRVTSIYPGSTATSMQEKIAKTKNIAYIAEKLIQPKDIALVIAQSLELPRTAEITDLVVRPFIKA